MDNDFFIGNDSGYTNGVFLSWWNGPAGEEPSTPGILVLPMMWSMPEKNGALDVDVGTIGQVIMTPNDILQDPPTLPPDDLPYAGILLYTDTLIRVQDDVADSVALSLGVVGKYSFAEETQKFVHRIRNYNEPCCWDSQLADEVVFQIRRERVWKSWQSDTGESDLLLGVDGSLGTISSSAGLSMMIRHGQDLRQTFATATVVNSRTANPIALQSGWFLFAGLRAGYLANHILLDGSKSYDGEDLEPVKYQKNTLGVSAGIALSWQKLSLTFAINDLNINESSDKKIIADYSRYGALTVAWKLN